MLKIQVCLFGTLWNNFLPNIFHPQLVEPMAVEPVGTEGSLYYHVASQTIVMVIGPSPCHQGATL